MSKELLPTTGRLGNAVRILCACAVLAIVPSVLTADDVTADDVAASSSSTGSTSQEDDEADQRALFDSMAYGGTVAKWRFARSEDRDYDGWPEGWERKIDRDHPPYLPIGIVAHDQDALALAQALDLQLIRQWKGLRGLAPSLPTLPPSVGDMVAGKYLRFDLDGGWAMVQSPPVKCDSLYRYQLKLSAKTESLLHDHVYAELIFLDAKGTALATHSTPTLTGSSKWRPLASELAVVPENAETMIVRLILRPIKIAGQTDIRGAAGFDDVTIRKLPQMKVTTDQRLALYEVNERPAITVRVLGLEHQAAMMHFRVRDVSGNIIATNRVPFSEVPVVDPSIAEVIAEELPNPPTPGSTKPNKLTETEQPDASANIREPGSRVAIEAVSTWQLPELPPGFYRIQSLLGDVDNPALQTESTFAILAPLAISEGVNPYGWAVPKTPPADLDVKRVPDWLHRIGVGAVKYRCWFAPDDKVQLETAAWVVQRLQEKEIRTIGMLDYPPPTVLAKIDERERREPYAANFFRDPAVWAPLVEPIMTRLSLKVRTWQLGGDADYSFLGQSQLKQKIRDIGRDLQGYGQPIGVAISWPWLERLPPASEQSWEAVQLSTSTALVADELDSYLDQLASNESPSRSRAETWVTIDPLDKSVYDLNTRITDLVLRMTTVRGHRVPATFVTNPVDPNYGLLREDWRPDELLLPWRTTAILLKDLTRAGKLPMPSGSETIVLANNSRTAIVIWNPVPTTERIYLGDSIRQIDVWGNAVTPKKITINGQPSHELNVGPVPTFLVDVDPVLVAFRMSTRLVEASLDSLLGQSQTVSLSFTNPTREPLSGEVRMKPMQDWEIDSKPHLFDLSPGKTVTQAFDVALRNSAKIGPAQLEFDFSLRSQPIRRFIVTRPIHVGPAGLDIEVTTRLVSGELLLTLLMTNRGEKETQYDCMIFPPGGQQYQRRQITIPPGTTVKRLFPWADGQSLVGQKMLLRAMEQNGDRVLNQVIDITP